MVCSDFLLLYARRSFNDSLEQLCIQMLFSHCLVLWTCCMTSINNPLNDGGCGQILMCVSTIIIINKYTIIHIVPILATYSLK